MSKILLRNIGYLITMNNKDEILRNVSLLIENNIIKSISYDNEDLLGENVLSMDCDGAVVMPGFVNTHHHLYQTMFRGIKEVQDIPLFPWLQGLYEFWKHLNDETVYYGSLVGFTELLRTGCTTTMDHHYVFPQNAKSTLIDTEIKAAREIGIRFHGTRGSMSLGKKQGGLPPSEVIQREEEILADSERLIGRYHDKEEFAMTRIALAPCSPFSVTKSLLWESKELARKNHVMLHTHLCETIDEEEFCRTIYGKTPVELMEELEWIGKDVWFAHGIHISDDEMKIIKDTGIAHCPSSNMKLGSGICRTSELIKAGIRVGIAVDGSASNDSSNMWEEIRRAYLLNHLKYGDKGLSAYDILKMATKGGAEVLGRKDIGILQPGKAADIVVIDLSDVAFTGCHDPIAAIVCCGNSSIVKHTIVNGKVVVKDGIVQTINCNDLIIKARKHAEGLILKQRSQR